MAERLDRAAVGVDSRRAGLQEPDGQRINRRITLLSSFYKYLAGAAAELRLPITVPNPAHAQFISREASDPADETRALSLARARQLMAMQKGDGIFDFAGIPTSSCASSRRVTLCSSPGLDSPLEPRTRSAQIHRWVRT